MNLTSVETIKKLARDNNIHPSALAGQNFLVDDKILRAIIKQANIKPGETILEIGPGFGVLTAALLATGAKVVAVERDRALIGYLRRRFKGSADFNLINQDILRLDVAARLATPYRIVANIPYSITGKIINMFISGPGPKPMDMLILVQKEVGERICAQPGKMSLLAIAVQLYAEPSLELSVPSVSFWPVPKVDSVLLKISNIKGKTLYPIPDERSFWRLLHIGFSSPRKQLHNNLAVGLYCSSDEVKKALPKAGISVKARAQELSIEQWVKLSEQLVK